MHLVVLIDLDGIIIKGRTKYFSDRLSEEHNIPIEKVLQFFQNEYGLAARGKSSIRKVLPAYLEEWGWSFSLDDFLQYWFEGEKTLDMEVINKIHELRSRGFKVYIVSDNEKERISYLNQELNLDQYVDGAFYSFELGFKKSESDFFKTVASRLNLPLNELIYWDDDPKNIEVARGLGINGHVFTGIQEFETSSEFIIK